MTKNLAAVMLAVLGSLGCGGDGEIRESDAPIFLTDVAEPGPLPVILAKETRLALAQDLPSRFEFDIDVPANAVLRFAVAVRQRGDEKQWPPIEFRILAEGHAEPLFVEALTSREAGRYHDREVELSSIAGRRAQLVFETRVDGDDVRVRRARRRALPLWGDPVVSSPQYRADRPNVVLISIDCLRADHVGAHGYVRPTTPRIDRLASDGTVFQAALAVSSWTLPTHLSMLTGLLPADHGVRRQQRLGADVATLPEILSDAGYRVDGVASWYYLSQTFGFDRGFHAYKLLVGRDAREIVDNAIDMVRRAEGTSQFLFVHLSDPHWPYEPPRQWLERFGRPRDIGDLHGRIERDEEPRDALEIDEAMQLYDAEIAYTDDQLGRLFDELDERGLYDNSLVIVTADHGEAFYEHGHWQHTVSLYDEVTHIPMIVKWPRSVQPARPARVEAPVSQRDIFATILDAVGAAMPDTGAVPLGRVSGRSVVSELTSPNGALSRCGDDTEPERECVTATVRVDTMKYTARFAEQDGELVAVEQELYDLAKDPDELDDLSATDSSRVDALSAEIRAYIRRAQARAGGAEVILDDETAEQLESLGYIQSPKP